MTFYDKASESARPWKMGQALNCRLVYPSHRDSKFIYWYWRMNSITKVKDVACAATNGRCVNKLSAGYYGIMLALDMCGKVDLYGFGVSGKKAGAYTRPPVGSASALFVGQGGVWGVFRAGEEEVFRRLRDVLSV